MKLYRLENSFGSYYVIAEHPTKAEDKLKEYLDKADYGYYDGRKVIKMEVMAESATDMRFITNKFLVL